MGIKSVSIKAESLSFGEASVDRGHPDPLKSLQNKYKPTS